VKFMKYVGGAKAIKFENLYTRELFERQSVR
jgi:hypothetical protein